MPLLDYSCVEHGPFEALRRAGAVSSAPCPTCEATSPRTYTAVGGLRIERAYDRQVDGKLPAAGRKEQDRAGGGKAVVVKETGGYRPALTHHTQCPKERRFRNVAVLAEMPYGVRLNCEVCGYIWVYHAKTTDIPLVAGVDESLRPGKRFFMGTEDNMTSGYIPAERGA